MKLTLSFIFFLMGTSNSLAHDDSFWKSFDNDFISIELEYKENPLVKARYPWIFRTLLEGTLGWHPGTVLHKKATCDLMQFKAAFIAEPVVANKQDVVREFLNRCDPVFSKSNLASGVKAISQRGSFTNHPFFKYAFLNFPNEIKTRAIVGIKNPEKRDLVIVRPGIFATVDELIAERYLLFLLTELNDYHVVILESSTGGDHFVNNQHGMIGGPKEAFENLYLMDQIRKNKAFGPLVEKIHLMGISLGANGVLLSSLVNKKENYRYFDKTLLLCPVVDLRASFQAKTQSGWVPFLLDWWSSRRFKDLKDKKDFELAPAVNSFFNLSPRWVRGAWSWFEKKYTYQPAWQIYLSKDFYNGDFKKDFEFFNDKTELPDNLYVLATRTDPIVYPEENYQKLLNRAGPNTFFYMFEDGFHCSFAYTYQWKFLDLFFSGIIESGGPKNSRVSVRYPLEVTKGVKDGSVERKDNPEIRSVEISKLEDGYVELLVYFLGHSHLVSGHARVPLSAFSLNSAYQHFDKNVVRNYIKRFVQTKADIISDKNGFFIKI